VRPILAHWHDDCLQHDTGSGLFEGGPSPLLAVPELHPENAERLLNVRSVMERGPLADDVEWREAPLATDAELATVHTTEHIASVDALAEADGVVCVEGSTFASAATPAAARRSAGAALAAADAAAGAEAAIAYACTRPPGHHAAPATTDGYCFFNNAALAAQRLRDRGAARVAVVDWDVHHGNGTQACFWERADVLAISVHMDHRSWGPHHPEDGVITERGAGAGLGATLNVPLPFGCGDDAYADAFDQVVLPALLEFVPDAIVCALGTDASQFDANGRMAVSGAGFHRIGAVMHGVAVELGVRSLVVTQEGGYARTYGAYGTVATLLGLLGRPNEIDDPLAYPARGEDAHRAAVAAAREAWELGAGERTAGQAVG